MITFKKILLSVTASVLLSANTLFGGAVLTGFDSSSLAGNDDGSTGFVNFTLGSLNFFGVNYTGAYLNNNGNMTFSGPLSQYTPTGITGASSPIIASFFADVDTRTGAVMRYGNGTFEGRNAFGQTWRNVGYYSNQQNLLNTFQTLLVERSDIAAGDFDIYFNYDSIQWDTGQVSNVSAVAGFSNGAGDYYQLVGSGVSGAFLNGGVNALNTHSLNRPEAGRYLFRVRNGTVSVPDGGSVLTLLGFGFAALLAARRKLG